MCVSFSFFFFSKVCWAITRPQTGLFQKFFFYWMRNSVPFPSSVLLPDIFWRKLGGGGSQYLKPALRDFFLWFLANKLTDLKNSFVYSMRNSVPLVPLFIFPIWVLYLWRKLGKTSFACLILQLLCPRKTYLNICFLNLQRFRHIVDFADFDQGFFFLENQVHAKQNSGKSKKGEYCGA